MEKSKLNPKQQPVQYWHYGRNDSLRLYPWKIHVYGATYDDFIECMRLTPTLDDKGWTYKVLHPAVLNYYVATPTAKQYGKMITLYPRSKSDFEEAVRFLDANLRPIINARIQGDRKLPCKSGRVFYRYELKTAEHKDRIFRMNSNEDTLQYAALYDSNRGGDRYMADGMTHEDDPFWEMNLNV